MPQFGTVYHRNIYFYIKFMAYRVFIFRVHYFTILVEAIPPLYCYALVKFSQHDCFVVISTFLYY